jgi:hypothetical protein
MGASQFEQSAGALKRKYWWKNLKVNKLYKIEILFVSETLFLLNLDDAHIRRCYWYISYCRYW